MFYRFINIVRIVIKTIQESFKIVIILIVLLFLSLHLFGFIIFPILSYLKPFIKIKHLYWLGLIVAIFLTGGFLFWLSRPPKLKFKKVKIQKSTEYTTIQNTYTSPKVENLKVNNIYTEREKFFDRKKLSEKKVTNHEIIHGIIDTSWIIDFAQILENKKIPWNETEKVVKKVFTNNNLRNLRLIMPRSILRELDGLKQDKDVYGRPTRKARLSMRASLILEILLKMKKLNFWDDIECKGKGYLTSEVDQKVVEVAKKVRETVHEYGNSKSKVYLLSSDRNQKLLAASYGITSFGDELLEKIRNLI